ncbi:MAG TPA: formate/nitrite transporter family protein [Saprospiraceae bacterium]|nr:formate/nitrite transporter family protein [Saprospiraceae bacterium]
MADLFGFWKKQESDTSDTLPSEESDVAKPLEQIYQQQLNEGLREYQRSPRGLFFSALLAGLELGFSLYFMGVVHELLKDQLNVGSLQIATSIAYPLGFIFVILGKSELFTEHTTLSVLPMLNGQKKPRDLARIWGTIYFGNWVGGLLMAILLVAICTSKGIITVETFQEIGFHFVDYSNPVIFGSAVLAGWLMGLVSWLVTSAQDTISRIVIIFLVTTVIGLGHLHHCVVGSIELIAGIISSEELGINDYVRVQLFATLGNIVGGVGFVALIKYKATSES